MSRIVALFGGGDWADASIAHVIVPDKMDLKQQSEAWSVWYRDTYRSGPHCKYISFTQWLINNGARASTEKDVEEFDEP